MELRSAKALEFYRENPARFALTQMGLPLDVPQSAAANALRDVVLRRVPQTGLAIRSGHGVGKSGLAGGHALPWFLYCFPGSKVIATAPKLDQVRDILWAEARKWIARSKLRADFDVQAERITCGTSVALARTGNKPESMQGFHPDFLSGGYILVIADEASGIDDAVFEPLEGALASEHAALLMLGNPTRISGQFKRAFGEKAEFLTAHISAENHPRVPARWVERMARKWGKDSDVYRVRVKGDFPLGDPQTFILLSRVEAAMQRDVAAEGELHIGCDVARFGDDRTVVFARAGLHVFSDPRIEGRTSIPDVVAMVLDYAHEIRQRVGRPNGTVKIKVDDGGLGAGVTDMLCLAAERDTALEICPCNFGGAGNIEYDNAATVMWAALRDCIDRVSLPDDEDLAGELSMRHFSVTAKGRIKLEPKEEFKKRLGSSPDLADALVLCFAEKQGFGAGSELATGKSWVAQQHEQNLGA